MALIRTMLLLLVTVAVAGAQTFTRVATRTPFHEMERVYAVADLDADGLDDLLVGGLIEHDPEFTPTDRLTKTRLRVYTSDGDGTYSHAPRITSRRILAHAAVVVPGDFNGDRRNDLAVYDAGAYVDSLSDGYGNPPQLFLSGRRGVLRYSGNLAAAVLREHRRDPPEPKAVDPRAVHLKMATAGDVDGDGDLDIWVESDGGNNLHSHFAINNGRGRFRIDVGNRAPDRLHHDYPPSWSRYHEALFVDTDRDGDSDLVLGRLAVRDHLDQRKNPSIILINDGRGFFRSRIVLPHPAFSNGFSRVMGATRYDINDDGWEDILLLHIRANDLFGHGRYVQALINTGDGFVDESTTRVRRQRRAARFKGDNYGRLAMHDVDRDGCADLVVTSPQSSIRAVSPLVYRNNGRGQFAPMAPGPFLPADPDEEFGRGAEPVDANGDGLIDFVVVEGGRLTTLLNTTRPRPVRCGGAR